MTIPTAMSSLTAFYSWYLTEGKLDNLKIKFPSIAAKLSLFADVNPKYFFWIANQLNLDPSIEPNELKMLIQKFSKASAMKLITQPLNSFGSVPELKKALPDKVVSNTDQTRIARDKTKILYQDGRYTLLEPLSNDSACYYGKNTKWCTSAKTGNLYYYYRLNGYVIFYLFDKTPSKPELEKIIATSSSSSTSFFDSLDRSMKRSDIEEIPERIKNIIRSEGEKKSNISSAELEQMFDFFDTSTEQNDNILAFIRHRNASPELMTKLFPLVMQMPLTGMFQGHTPVEYRKDALKAMLNNTATPISLKQKINQELKLL